MLIIACISLLALMFLGVSAVYPKFGYAKRHASVAGPDEELRPAVKEFFRERGYDLESDTPEQMTFRTRSAWHRITTFGEDRITVTGGCTGLTGNILTG